MPVTISLPSSCNLMCDCSVGSTWKPCHSQYSFSNEGLIGNFRGWESSKANWISVDDHIEICFSQLRGVIVRSSLASYVKLMMEGMEVERTLFRRPGPLPIVLEMSSVKNTAWWAFAHGPEKSVCLKGNCLVKKKLSRQRESKVHEFEELKCNF